MKWIKQINSKLKFNKILKNESGQGMTEYILLIVVVVALAYVFKDRIKGAVKGKTEEVGSRIEGFSGE